MAHSASALWMPEEVVRIKDVASGLEGTIVLHSTRLGPAAGGCRLWRYPDIAAASADALRLAQGMTYKNALAGLPLGGGKAVLRMPTGAIDRVALFAAFGRAVAALDGRYVTAEDVGTSVADMTVVSGETPHVAGLPPMPGQPGGDPSPWTARGVFAAMQVAVRRRLGRDLRDVTVAVQGLGHVGMALCESLHAAGARLIVSELRSDVAATAAVRFGAELRSGAALADAAVDVFAPCALGGAIDDRVARTLRATVVCGAANNQLASATHGHMLADRGILYAPDYLVNAGGIINVAAEYLGWSVDDVASRVDAIGARFGDVLDLAETHGCPTNEASDALAEAILTETAAASPVWLAA